MGREYRANETELNNIYKVPENVMDRFQNIMTFTKNMTLKDSKFFEKYEDSLSSDFGDLLIKYFIEGLDDKDISSLLTLIVNYNDAVDSLFKEDNEESSVNRAEYIFGLYGYRNLIENGTENIDKKIPHLNHYESSFFRFIVLKIYEENKENIDLKKLKKEDIIKSLYEYLLKKGFSKFEEITSEENIMDIVRESINNNLNELQDLYDAFKNRLKILYTTTEFIDGETSKREASIEEKQMAESGEPLVFFDIKCRHIKLNVDKNVLDKLGSTSNNDRAPITLSPIATLDNVKYNVSIQILYKELNLAYRDALEADILELIAAKQWNSLSNIMSNKQDSITSEIMSSIRSIKDNIMIRDIKNEKDGKTYTTKLFKYRYGNPFMARRAAESEIITYYVGDNYISNGYGKYIYHKNEIYKFLEIFKETREYFYQVLLNESFVNESEYSTYEKLYLTFLSVVRFMDSKIDTIRDIDSFSRDDILNFLESFGFGSLSGIIETDDFVNSEAYAKSLIKRYIDLVQYKGSRQVIDTLQEIFSINTTEMTVYKNILIGAVDKDDNSESKLKHRYRVLKTEYDNTNQISTIDRDINDTIEMESFVAKDKYWDSVSISSELLNEIGVSVANTKYIIPEVTNEYSEAYLNTRLVFELIDYIFKKYEISTVVSEDSSSSQIITTNEKVLNDLELSIDYMPFKGSIHDFINCFRNLWKTYMELKGITISDEVKYHFTISENPNLIPVPSENKNENYKFIPAPSENENSNIIPVIDYQILENLGIKDDNNEYYDLEKMFEMINTDNNNKTIKLKDGIKNIILTRDVSDIVRTKIIGYIESLGKLFILKDLDNFKALYGEPIKTSSFVNFIKSIIMDSLPYGFVSGEITDASLPAETYHFLRVLYNNIFFENETNNPLDKDGGNYNFSDILCRMDDEKSVLKGLTTALNDLIAIFGEIKLNINLSGKDNAMLRFLETAMRYFISYTADIYEFSYKNSYNTKDETLNMNDSVKTTVSYTDVDSFYYDEKLSIEIKPKPSQDENQ